MESFNRQLASSPRV